MAIKEPMLTTKDNPYNPFVDFNKWLDFDNQMGYGSCQYLARIAKTSDNFTDEETFEELHRAIDEIIQYDIFGIYTKVVRED